MSIPFIDIHTHRQRAGIKCIVSYSIGRDKWPVAGHSLVSAGIHPWDAESVGLEDAYAFLATAPIVAIGETGLDFARDVDRKKQVEVFESQLQIAEARGLPIVIHCVKAYNEVLNILRKFKLKAVIFHGYTGSQQQTATIIEQGYYISLGEVSLKSTKTLESLRGAPLDRIFVETDTSDVAIEDIYKQIAKIKQIGVEVFAEGINANFKRIFE